MEKNRVLEKEVFELVGDAYAANSGLTIKALEAACKILDNKFGVGFHKQHPELAVQMTESILKNCRMNDFDSAIKNGIGEYLDALRIVILEKDIKLSGSISVDIPDEVRIQS